MPKVTQVFDVKALAREDGSNRYYNVGKVVFYEDGTMKLRMNHLPHQEYRMFSKTKLEQK